MVSIFNKVAYAPTVDLFDQFVHQFIKEGGDKAIDFLRNFPKEHYAISHFNDSRYGELCSNAVESFNAQILKYRDLPILEVVDGIRLMLMEQMYGRSREALQWTTILCPKINTIYAKNKEICRTWNVYQSGPSCFEVHSDPVMCVDYEKGTCSCGQWQERHYPCEHGFAALFKCGLEPYHFFDPYFHTSKFIECYSKPIVAMSTFGSSEPETPGELFICPPICKRQPGRPRKKRIPSRGEEESKKRIKCGKCGTLGHHNRKTCPSNTVIG
jgi:zinc finger SWIM domain-containing protein 3